MAKKNINKRCPLSVECERKTCEFINTEHKCDYYKYNALGDNVIPDQEEILELQRKQLDMELENELDTNDLIYIPVTLLHPHPNNPRKDLGELTELANSIKEKGIMQNLTVVPRREGTYTVIIGHRRLAAAKAAGLTEVPCIITEMSPQDQLATMLLENMQRNDLTLYEQAQGFQMMIDFGENVETISKKTGLSESTVRRRVKLSELNQDTLKKVSDRQISIGDLDRLSKIEDENERNKVLSHIGTNNFENEFKKALEAQKTQKIIAKTKEAFADIDITEIQHQDYSTQTYERSFYYETGIEKGVEYVKELIDSGKKCFIEYGRYDYFYIYTERVQTVSSTQSTNDNDTENEEETEAQAQARQERERQEKLRQLKEIRENALKEAFDRAYQLRFDYIKSFTEAKSKEYATQIIELNLKSAAEDMHYADNKMFAELMDIDFSKVEATNEKNEFNFAKEAVTKSPFKALLSYTYCYLDTKLTNCYDDDLTYQGDEYLSLVYEQLATLGYDPSDEEIELLNGSSPLYLKENDNQDNT